MLATTCMAVDTEDKPVPEVGRIYHVFDDGKITRSRHSLERVVKVIPIGDFVHDVHYVSWLDAAKHCDWLFRNSTDFVVVTEAVETDSNNVYGGGYYARTKDGGWFAFGHFFGDGLLDVDGKVWDEFLENVRGGKRFDYDAGEIEEIEKWDNIVRTQCV